MNALLASHRHAPSRPPRASDALRKRLAFGVVALLIFAIDGSIARSSWFLARPDLFTAAITFDLTIVVTLAYWLIVVRRGAATARTLIPVFVFAVGAATLTLPPGHRGLVHYARFLAAPFEVAILVAIVFGVRKAHRRLVGTGIELDIPERIRRVLDTSLLAPRAADILATEGSIFYFALAAWRRPPFLPRNARAFTYHKKRGVAGVLYALAAASAVEVAIVDLLVRLHAPRTANTLIALGVVSTVWLIGFARAIQLSPHFLTPDSLSLRFGLRYRADIPRDAIAAVTSGSGVRTFASSADALRMGRGTPNVVIDFRAPVVVRGAYGTRRLVARVGLFVDEPAAFARAIEPTDAH